jgi:hypothetical protein
VHAIQATYKGTLAAAGWSNQSRSVVGGNIQIDVLQRVISSVPRIQGRYLDANAHVCISPSALNRNQNVPLAISSRNRHLQASHNAIS